MVERRDVCGIGPGPGGFVTTDGLGGILALRDGQLTPLAVRSRAWDNHLVALT